MNAYADLCESLLDLPVPKSEHDRLRNDLMLYAYQLGYRSNVGLFLDGSVPDALFVNNNNNWLFLGDAKDVANETPSRKETYDRIQGYVTQFTNHLMGSPRLTNRLGYNGGHIAIATNCPFAAENWRYALYRMAIAAGLVWATNRQPVSFRSTHWRNRTWLVHL